MSVSIIIPTYHRKKFEKLIEYNINLQTYFNILEVIILDDGNDEPLCIKTKYPIHYYTIPRCSIGTKRNIGVQVAQGHYIAFMDTDDFYMPDYIAHSIFEMESNDKSIAGCADMNVYDFTHFYKQRCIFLHYLNEATMVFKKSVFTSGTPSPNPGVLKGVTPLFTDANSNEAVSFLLTNIDKIIETNIDKIMCCVSHTTNTIPKEPWCTDKYKIKSVENGFNPFIQYTNHCKILSTLNV